MARWFTLPIGRHLSVIPSREVEDTSRWPPGRLMPCQERSGSDYTGIARNASSVAVRLEIVIIEYLQPLLEVCRGASLDTALCRAKKIFPKQINHV